MCFYGNELYQTGDVFTADDDCNMCVCADGYVGCTEIQCPNRGKYNPNMSVCVRNPIIWVLTRSDTNQPVQSQKMV